MANVEMVDIICDTSFLMVLVSTPIKQLERIEAHLGRLNFLVPDIVIDELRRLEKRAGPKRSIAARTAIDLSLSRFKVINLIPAGGEKEKEKEKESIAKSVPKPVQVDDYIANYAVTNRCPVATIDIRLRNRLLSGGTLVLTLSKNKLVVMQPSPTR
jgi:rRNA-processing protein FCF1